MKENKKKVPCVEADWLAELESRESLVCEMRKLEKSHQCAIYKNWRKQYQLSTPYIAVQSGVDIEKLVSFEKGNWDILSDDELFAIQFFQTFKKKHLRLTLSHVNKYDGETFFDKYVATKDSLEKKVNDLKKTEEEAGKV